MNNAILNVAIGILTGVVVMLCAVVHRQQRQIDDMSAFVHVAEAAAADQIGRNADESFRRLAEKLGQ